MLSHYAKLQCASTTAIVPELSDVLRAEDYHDDTGRSRGSGAREMQGDGVLRQPRPSRTHVSQASMESLSMSMSMPMFGNVAAAASRTPAQLNAEPSSKDTANLLDLFAAPRGPSTFDADAGEHTGSLSGSESQISSLSGMHTHSSNRGHKRLMSFVSAESCAKDGDACSAGEDEECIAIPAMPSGLKRYVLGYADSAHHNGEQLVGGDGLGASCDEGHRYQTQKRCRSQPGSGKAPATSAPAPACGTDASFGRLSSSAKRARHLSTSAATGAAPKDIETGVGSAGELDLLLATCPFRGTSIDELSAVIDIPLDATRSDWPNLPDAGGANGESVGAEPSVSESELASLNHLLSMDEFEDDLTGTRARSSGGGVLGYDMAPAAASRDVLDFFETQGGVPGAGRDDGDLGSSLPSPPPPKQLSPCDLGTFENTTFGLLPIY
jgi:hypothetical protein